MKPNELIRKLKTKFGPELDVIANRGKGSHRMVYLHGRKASLKQHGDLGPGTVKEFLKQLGVSPDEL